MTSYIYMAKKPPALTVQHTAMEEPVAEDIFSTLRTGKVLWPFFPEAARRVSGNCWQARL